MNTTPCHTGDHHADDPVSSPRRSHHNLNFSGRARVGKIARLPQMVRQLLNLRMQNGEKGSTLVAWLNGLPEVWMIIMLQFGGKAITEQNLSEWRQGGFLEWQRHQDAIDRVRLAAEQVRELGQEAGETPLTDVLSASVTLLLMRLIQEVSEAEAGASTPESRRELQGLIRQWTLLRQADQRGARLKMAQSTWATARAREAEEAARKAAAAEQAEVEALATSKRAKLPVERVAGFESRYKAEGWRAFREKMELAQRESMMGILCSGVGRDKAEVLRDQVENAALDRGDDVLKEVDRLLGNEPAPVEPDPMQAYWDEFDLDHDETSESDLDLAERSPSDPIRPHPGESDPIKPQGARRTAQSDVPNPAEPDPIQPDPGESDLIQPEAAAVEGLGGKKVAGSAERSSKRQGCSSHVPQAAPKTPALPIAPRHLHAPVTA